MNLSDVLQGIRKLSAELTMCIKDLVITCKWLKTECCHIDLYYHATKYYEIK